MSKEVLLDNWAVCIKNPYQAPEIAEVSLSGEVYDHPCFLAGDKVYTTTILRSEGRKVWTKNTCYTLGKPAPSYVAWCKENGITIDPNNPVKIT
jgi:hypothetical protein